MKDVDNEKFHWHYVIDKNTKEVVAKYGYECYAREFIDSQVNKNLEYKLGEERNS